MRGRWAGPGPAADPGGHHRSVTTGSAEDVAAAHRRFAAVEAPDRSPAHVPDPADRQRFAATVLGSGAVRLGVEDPGVVPGPAAADPHGAGVRRL